MGNLEEMIEESQPRREVKTSFFTRKLSSKLGQGGSPIPASVIAFLDTPVCTLDEKWRIYFEEQFCPMIPSLVNVLAEIFDEIGAEEDGWDDMITYSGNMDTPIKICARAVLARKKKAAENNPAASAQPGQRTKKIQLPPQLQQLNPTAC
jgi:hypothetical protein